MQYPTIECEVLANPIESLARVHPFTTYIGARKDWCIINPMEFRLKERLSKTNARIIPKAVFGIIGVALSFWFVMFLKQFDQEKKKK